MRNGQDVPPATHAASSMEWLITSGAGGSASGTAGAAASRRTHALLTAASLHGRLTTLLLGFDERLMDAAGSWNLPAPPAGNAGARASSRGVIESFSVDPAPTWRIRAGAVVIERRIRMISGHHAIIVGWKHVSGPEARLTVGPCVVCRAPNRVAKENADARGATQGVPGRIRIEFGPDDPALTLWHNGAFLPARVWRRGLRYALDPHPDETEDALVPGWIDAELSSGQPVYVVAAAEADLFRRLAAEDRLGAPPPRSLAECVALIERDARIATDSRRRASRTAADFTARQAAAAHNSPLSRRREALVAEHDRWAEPLGDAIHAALTARAHHLRLACALPGPAAHAGDPMRAVPGLVTLRRFDEAREVLKGALEHLNEGLAPEGYDPADGTPRYGDPCAALWLVHAADIYVRRSEDTEGLRDALYPALEGVMQFYRAGTHNVCVGEHGLLETVRERRSVAPADLNSLWYHALVAMAQMARLVGRKENGAFYLAWARELQQRFGELMWDEANGRLFEGIEDGRAIPGLQPSQVLAASLQPVLLSPDRARRLIDGIGRDLFTPFGLRERPLSDVAISCWLGPWYTAYVRAHGRDPAALSRVHDWLDMLRDALGGPAIIGVPATFTRLSDGTPRGSGEVSTAAAGELLRAWIEDLDPSAAPERTRPVEISAVPV